MLSHLNGYGVLSRFAAALAALAPGAPAAIAASAPWAPAAIAAATPWSGPGLDTWSITAAPWSMQGTAAWPNSYGSFWPHAGYEPWQGWAPYAEGSLYGGENLLIAPSGRSHVAAQWGNLTGEPCADAVQSATEVPLCCAAPTTGQAKAAKATVEKHRSDGKQQGVDEGLAGQKLKERQNLGRLRGVEAVNLLSILQKEGELEDLWKEGFEAQKYYEAHPDDATSRSDRNRWFKNCIPEGVSAQELAVPATLS